MADATFCMFLFYFIIYFVLLNGLFGRSIL